MTTKKKKVEMKETPSAIGAERVIQELEETIPGEHHKVPMGVPTTEVTQYPTKDTQIQKAEQMSVEFLIGQAIDKGVPVETMERLLAMRKELKAEYAKEEYDKAMAQFQAECPIIKKTKAGGKTNNGEVAYKYAPLESIVEQTKEAISRNGFSYMVRSETKETGVKAIVIVKHKAGHSEPTDVEVPLGAKTGVMSAPQVTASALTFAKRYAFCNAFGILTGDEDNDAQTLNSPVYTENKPRPQNLPKSEGVQPPQADWKKLKISDMQMKKLENQLKMLGKDKEWFEKLIEDKTKGTIVGIENLNRGWASTFIDAFEKKLKDPNVKTVQANVPSVDIDDRPNYEPDPVEDTEESTEEIY